MASCEARRGGVEDAGTVSHKKWLCHLGAGTAKYSIEVSPSVKLSPARAGYDPQNPVPLLLRIPYMPKIPTRSRSVCEKIAPELKIIRVVGKAWQVRVIKLIITIMMQEWQENLAIDLSCNWALRGPATGRSPNNNCIEVRLVFHIQYTCS